MARLRTKSIVKCAVKVDFMNNWQPIETAPKDGSQIFILNKDGASVASWVDYSGSPIESQVKDTDGNLMYWQALICGWHVWIYKTGDEPNVSCDNPTHWMPIPPIN